MTTRGNTARKIGVSIPPAVLRAVDSAARHRGETRSGFIVHVLQVATARARDREVTRRLDALFADADLREEALETAEALSSPDDDEETAW